MIERQRKYIMGRGGECICPKCEYRIAHRRWVPCQEEHCPKCGGKMLRVGSEHHDLWVRKHKR